MKTAAALAQAARILFMWNIAWSLACGEENLKTSKSLEDQHSQPSSTKRLNWNTCTERERAKFLAPSKYQWDSYVQNSPSFQIEGSHIENKPTAERWLITAFVSALWGVERKKCVLSVRGSKIHTDVTEPISSKLLLVTVKWKNCWNVQHLQETKKAAVACL